MTDGGRVLVVALDAAASVADRLGERGLAAETAATVGDAAADSAAYDCMVCGEPPETTVAEAVSRFGDAPVVVAYETDEAATTALAAGADATIPARDPDRDWVAHLAATVDRVGDTAPARVDDSLLAGAVDHLPDVFFVVSTDGEFLHWNRRLVEVSGYGDSEIAGMQPTDFFEGDDVERIRNAIGRVVMNGEATEAAAIVTKDGRAIPHRFTGALVETDDETAIVGTARDVRERRERERELDAQADRLAAVTHANDVVRAVIGALLGAETREAVTERVCAELAGGDAYRFAWVGSYDAAADRVEPEAWAGEGAGYLDDRPDAEPAGGDSATALTAVRRGEPVVVQDVAASPTADAWRDAALAHGHRAAAVIPLAHDGTTYGCLALAAGEPGAFGELEREVLAELGELTALAIRAAETRRALAADTVTELQFRAVDEDWFLVQAADRVDADVDLVGSVERPDGAISQLFAVHRPDPEVVREVAAAAPVAVSVVAERDAECVVKVVVEEPSVSHVLASVGGSVEAITASGGEVRLRVSVPQSADPEAVVADVRAVRDVELVAQREVQRDEPSDAEFRVGVEDRLTDRQLEVLEAAYVSGFFDWPREQTGEEVADVLDVSPPTFHQHLRVAQRKLVDVLLDPATDT
jgi:PAS domain S-box-containing protein